MAILKLTRDVPVQEISQDLYIIGLIAARRMRAVSGHGRHLLPVHALRRRRIPHLLRCCACRVCTIPSPSFPVPAQSYWLGPVLNYACAAASCRDRASPDGDKPNMAFSDRDQACKALFPLKTFSSEI